MKIPTIPRFRYFRSLLIIVLYAATVMGMVMGANAGYTAESVEETQYEYKDSAIYVGGELEEDVSVDSNEDAQQYQPWYAETVEKHVPGTGVETSIGDTVERWANSFRDAMLWLGFTLAIGAADVTATFVYHNQWIPSILLNGIFQIAGLVPLAYAGYLMYSRMQMFGGGGAQTTCSCLEYG